jgi:uncharacterized membrane protein
MNATLPENQDQTNAPKKTPPPRLWYWLTVALAVATAVAVFTISDAQSSLMVIRSALGLIFVLFLPGFAFIRALFPERPSSEVSGEQLERKERLALSMGVSLIITPVTVLILNIFPGGVTVMPVTLSLLAITLVFATIALIREANTNLITRHSSEDQIWI